MTSEEKATIVDLRKCDFTQMASYFKEQTEIRKQMGKEDKNVGVFLQGNTLTYYRRSQYRL